MNINKLTNAVGAYKAVSYDKELKNKTVASAREKNTDKVEFSTNKNNTDTIKANIVKYVDSSATAERISALRTSISEGKYNVPAESIALAITEA